MSSAIPYDEESNPFASQTGSPASPAPAWHGNESAEEQAPQPPAQEREQEQEEHEHEQVQVQENEQDQSEDQELHKDDDDERPLGETHHADQPPAQEQQPKQKVKKYKLITKITGLERQGKKDPIIKFDAYTTLPRFRTTTFKDIRRTHHEFVKFFEHLNGNNPECFVPSVPAATTSAGAGTEEDESKVKYKMQLWLDRITANPILARDEEFVYFIEADFGYSPVVKRKPPATGLARKAMKQLAPPHDEITELAEFRPLVKQVFLTSSDAHAKLERVTKTRRNLGLAMNDFGTKTTAMTDLEHHAGMINMWRKVGKVVMAMGDLEAIKATAEAASFGDGINWVAQDAYVAKEAMTNRHLLMRDLTKAQASTKSKHQTAVRVKGSTNLSAVKVDEAITALDEATQHEERLTNKVRRVSDNMLLEKSSLMNHFETDIKGYIGEYVLRMIESERRALSTWESVRLDVRAVDSNGGLSRLGRESTPANRRAALAASQGPGGDSWSGDRHDRAPDYVNNIYREERPKEEDSDEGLQEDEETVVDARNAASLLAGSTF